MNDEIQKDQNEQGEQILSALPDGSISAAIGKLMEHPEIISMVASAIGGKDNKTENGDGSDSTQYSPDEKSQIETTAGITNNTEGTEILSSVMPMLSKLSSLGLSSRGESSKKGGKHDGLLCALKPYVSPHRSEAIDYILKISHLTDIIGKLR